MKSAFDQFLENNKVSKKTVAENYELSNLWCDDSFICKLPKTTNFSIVQNILLPKELLSIYHRDRSEIEFIFNILDPDENFLKRTTKFFHKGYPFDTRYDQPSEALKLLATGFRETGPATESDYRNLRYFRDYYKKDNLPESRKEFFKNKTPISFFVKGDFSKINNDFIGLSKHMNIYSRYYDRKTPFIIILEDEKSTIESKVPCLSENEGFPEQVIMNELDQVIVDLFQVASITTNIRLRFLFYYQILEYLAYYFTNNDLKTKLNNILKNPDLISKSSLYSRQIIEELKESFKTNDDKVRLERLIVNYCSIPDIKNEMICNISSFTQNTDFDGGFILESIIKDEKELENPPNDLMKKLVDRLDKLRNVLVHIREYRENKAILPTRTNNHKLLPFLYLIRRVAEVVAIKNEY